MPTDPTRMPDDTRPTVHISTLAGRDRFATEALAAIIATDGPGVTLAWSRLDRRTKDSIRDALADSRICAHIAAVAARQGNVTNARTYAESAASYARSALDMIHDR